MPTVEPAIFPVKQGEKLPHRSAPRCSILALISGVRFTVSSQASGNGFTIPPQCFMRSLRMTWHHVIEIVSDLTAGTSAVEPLSAIRRNVNSFTLVTRRSS